MATAILRKANGQFTAVEVPLPGETKPVTKRRAMLKDWSISKKNQASNKLWMTFKGRVYGHPSFEDGAYVETSPVLHIDTVAGVAETMHTIYLLG